MSDKNVTSKLCSLEQLALHEIAKKICYNLFLEVCEEVSNSHLSANYYKYRDKVLEVLLVALPSGFPILWKDKLLNPALTVLQGCYDAYHWKSTLNHKFIIPQSSLHNRQYKLLCDKVNSENALMIRCQDLLFNTGKYEAIAFINPLGHFDNLSWAKLFVNDENQCQKFRFYLACFYCFEEEINNLWSSVEINKCQGRLWDNATPDIFMKAKNLVEIWVYHLEGEIVNSFYLDGFKLAYQVGQEHAAKYFWRHCSANERTEILSGIDFRSLHSPMKVSHEFVYFIYSLLSVDSKKSLISCFTDDGSGSDLIWKHLLRSYYFESVLNDILTFPDTIPLVFYKCILGRLAMCLFVEIPLYRHKKVFKILWNHLTQDERNEALGNGKLLIFLISNHDLDLFGTVVLTLPRSMKENMLFNFYEYFLRNSESLMLKIYGDKYEAFLRCLLFFFLDYEESGSQKLTLRSDAVNVLDRFVESEAYISWITSEECNMEIRKECNMVTEHFRETLPVIDQLITQKNYTAFPFDFLSRKIYPLFSIKGKLNYVGKEKENPNVLGAEE